VAVLRGLALGGGLTVAVVLALGVSATLAWPIMFPLFHEVFFPPGTWQFGADSGLISLFPERFWFESALAAFALVAGAGAVLAVSAWGVLRGMRR
jgi:uncharacterized membrane protein